jgi:Uncharacterised nucleotidyltransferase
VKSATLKSRRHTHKEDILEDESHGDFKSRRSEPEKGSHQLEPKSLPWPDLIPMGQWTNYRSAIEAAKGAGLNFLLGGGFALATYTGLWRNTKDIDFYILPRDREPMIAALSSVGFVDYYDTRPYDPGWIYRSTREGIIVDIIWSMANRRAEVDEQWFGRAHPVQVREEILSVAPVEELLWCKIYILQRDHCDWTDIFNIFYCCGPKIDWDHLIERVEPDLALLRSCLMVYDWLCPNKALELPSKMRRRLELPKPRRVPEAEQQRRIRLLDSRSWFSGMHPITQQLEV